MASGILQFRWVVLAAAFAIAASRGSAAQDLPPSQHPSFAGTWMPAVPDWSDLLFKNGMSFVTAVSGKGRLIIEQRPDRLIITKQLPDDALDMMLDFVGRYETTTVWRIVMPQDRSGRLVFQIPDAARPTTVTFSLDGEQLKVENHVVYGPGRENNTPELFTRVK